MREIDYIYEGVIFPKAEYRLLIFVIGASVVLAEFHLSFYNTHINSGLNIFGAFLGFSWNMG
jgi:hypothetical protein